MLTVLQIVTGRSMNVLELHDPEAGVWLAGHADSRPAKRPASPSARSQPSGKRVPLRDAAPGGAMHLMVGCSVARGSRMEVAGDDLLIDKSRGGETWARLRDALPGHLAEWRRAASAFGLPLGTVIFWLSGNDAYDKRDGHNRIHAMDDEEVRRLEQCVTDTVSLAGASASSVVILGPLPRIAFDLTLPWEHTAAYKMDRKTKEATADSAEFISIGQSLTRKVGRRSRHLITEECRTWFAGDGIHLSPAGYRKVAAVQRFPRWIVLRAAAE